MQLELHRLAAQEVLQRLAPDLAVQISAILRTYSRSVSDPDQRMPDNAPTSAHLAALQPKLAVAFDSSATQGSQEQLLHVSANKSSTVDAHVGGADGTRMGSTEGVQMGSTAVPARHISNMNQLASGGFDGLAAEDSQQELLGINTQSSTAVVPNRRTSRFNQLPTALSNAPMEQLPFEPFSPNAAPVSEAAEQGLPMTSASIRAQAWQLQQQLLQDMKQGRLVMLSDGETMQQASHCVVLQGSVKLQGQPIVGNSASGMIVHDAI